MNKNKLRWAIYRILVKEHKILRPKRGGFSLDFLIEFLTFKYRIEIDIFDDPLTVIASFFSIPVVMKPIPQEV